MTGMERGVSFRMSHREGGIQVSTRFMTDRSQMRAMSGRSYVHAQIVNHEVFAHLIAATVGSHSTGGK
jgi:hypothetical protein